MVDRIFTRENNTGILRKIDLLCSKLFIVNSFDVDERAEINLYLFLLRNFQYGEDSLGAG
jgi:hypothetical protein